MEIKWRHQRFWTQVSCNLLQKSLTKLWAQTQLNSEPNQCHKTNTGPRKCMCFTSIIWQPWMTSRSTPHSMPQILYLFVWTGETLLVSGSFPQKLSSVSSGKCHIATRKSFQNSHRGCTSSCAAERGEWYLSTVPVPCLGSGADTHCRAKNLFSCVYSSEQP